MAQIEQAQIIRAVARSVNGQGKLKAAATQRFKVIFDDSVKGMQKEFEADPVTRELDGGVDASNISETLGGGGAPDNLFSFIGFDEGSKPTQPIREALDPKSRSGPKLGPTVQLPNASNGLPVYGCQVSGPKINEIYAQTPIPWGPGMSWAEKIETDIPGLARFLARYTTTPPSHSGGGLQAKGDLPSRDGARFTPPEKGYLSRIFSNFAEAVHRFTKQRNR